MSGTIMTNYCHITFSSVSEPCRLNNFNFEHDICS